jgi:carbamoyl-phosphate synthase large subunit
MNILITSAGQRVSLVKAFQKELKGLFENGKVWTVDLNPELSPACRISDGYRKVRHVNDHNYITDLLSICKEWGIKLIVPTIDTELLLLSKNRDFFKENNILIAVSDLNFVRICRDKRLMNDFFIQNDIAVPESIDKKNPTFPLFIKPYDGSLSKDIFLIEKNEDFTDYHFSNEKLLFMEYIDPKCYKEYTVDAYYDKNGILKCCVPRERIAVRSGEISKGVTSKNYLHNFLLEKLPKIEGACGCLTIQFFYNEKANRVVGIEINPRFGGGYPLSYLSGANYPLWLIKEYLLNEEITFFIDWEDKMLMLRYDDEVIIHNYNG